MTIALTRLRSHVLDEPAARFRHDVWSGLKLRPKQIPSKYFYDAAGSALFEQITALREYYLTRTETGIMRQTKRAMAAALGSDVWLIEYGSGSSTKTRTLLDELEAPAPGPLPPDRKAPLTRRGTGASLPCAAKGTPAAADTRHQASRCSLPRRRFARTARRRGPPPGPSSGGVGSRRTSVRSLASEPK